MLLSTLATLGSLGSAIYGQVQSRRYNDKARNEEMSANLENERILQTRLNSDFSRGSEFQGYWNAKQKADDRRIAIERGVNEVVGGNDNALNAQREAISASEAQMGSSLASRADAVKMATERGLMAENGRHANVMRGIYDDRAKQVTSAVSQYRNSMGQIAKADSNTLGDDLNFFGVALNKDKWERVQAGDGYHWVRKREPVDVG